MSYFSHIEPIRYQGPASDQPRSFRWYDKDRVVMGKRMEDHLRFAVCYWHTFAWTGGDPFGGDTFERPWFQGGTPMAPAERKAEQAFEFSPGWVRPTPVSMIGKWHPKATHRARATPTFGTWWNNWRDTSSARV